MTDQQGEKPTPPDLPAPLAAALGFIDRLSAWAETIDAANDVLAAEEGRPEPDTDDVRSDDPTRVNCTVVLADGSEVKHFARGSVIENGTLIVKDPAERVIAVYAPGRWSHLIRDEDAAAAFNAHVDTTRSEVRKAVEDMFGNIDLGPLFVEKGWA